MFSEAKDEPIGFASSYSLTYSQANCQEAEEGRRQEAGGARGAGEAGEAGGDILLFPFALYLLPSASCLLPSFLNS